MEQEITITFTVNGRVITRRAPGHYSLLRWLRDVAAQHDVKYGCGEGVCGSCAVLVDGKSVNSCLVPAARFDGSQILTAAGLAHDGVLNDLQQAFLEYGAAQCGFCTPGMLMAATELLDSDKALNHHQIREGLHGNLCRCTGYQQIVEAVEAVSSSRAKEDR